MGWASLGEKRAEHPSVRGHECQKVDSVGYIFRPCGLATVQLQPLWRNWRNLQAYYVTVTEDRPIRFHAEYPQSGDVTNIRCSERSVPRRCERLLAM